MLVSSNTDALKQILQQGGVIAYPTEAVFGLGCAPLNETAVMRLLALKQRSIDKGLILIASDFSQVADFLLPLSKQQKNQTQGSEITWVFPAKKNAPRWITGKFDSIAIRVTQHLAVKQLCQSFGSALISTSANRSGLEPAKTCQEVLAQFNQLLDGILDNKVGQLCKPTEIRDSVSGEIIRS